MEPFLTDPDITLWQGDVRTVLSELADESVDCVITSPPYWGLRDYGTGEWTGGDPECDHLRPTTTMNRDFNERWGQGGGERKQEHKNDAQYPRVCEKCGAERKDSQLGLEETPEEFIEAMVEVFREVRRVLAPHGTLWLNLGDSFAAGGKGPGGSTKQTSNTGANIPPGSRTPPPGYKQKDLIGVPWEVALALRRDGWWLRSDIVWAKPNPMPESVDDRPTKAHEYVFMLAKSGEPHYWTHRFTGQLVSRKPEPSLYWHPPLGSHEEPVPDEGMTVGGRTRLEGLGWKKRNAWEGHDYFYDQEAVREPYETTRLPGRAVQETQHYGAGNRGNTGLSAHLGDVHERLRADSRPQVETLDGSEGEAPRGPDGRRETHVQGQNGSIQHRDGERWPNEGRNMRSVWTISIQPYPGAHFATFPEELVRKALLAGCPLKVCRVCGKPRVRVMGRSSGEAYEKQVRHDGRPDGAERRKIGGGQREFDSYVPARPVGWTDCECADYRPGVVLDPFGGTGTTAAVARKHGRHAVLVELNPEYCDLIADRTRQLSLLTEA